MFESLLQSQVDLYDIPGLSVLVERDDKEIVSFNRGECELSGNQAIDADTLFGVASITKFVTTLQILLLVDQGRLSLDDPVAKYLPEFEFAAQSRACIRHLLSHSAGLPGLDSRFKTATGTRNDSAGDSGLLSYPDLVKYLNAQQIQPLAPSGELFSYSNESFCLLGGIIERLTNKHYVQSVTNSVLLPLGMNQSIIGNPGATENIRVAELLERCSNGFHALPVWDAPLFYAAGGVVSSARELIRLFRVLDKKQRFLSSASYLELTTRQLPVLSRPSSGSAYGLGLEHQRLADNSTLLWHSGQRVGVSSFAGYLPEFNIAIAVLSNVADVPVTAIAFKLIASMLHRVDIVWPPLNRSAKAKPDIPSRCIGRYASREAFDVQIVNRDNAYYLLSQRDAAPRKLQFRDQWSGTVEQQSFRFLTRNQNDAEPWALALDLRVLPRVG